MKPCLFENIIFGPIKSRRLGHSLGINLLPTSSKLCNFECIYCECGWSEKHTKPNHKSPEHSIVIEQLISKIQNIQEKGAIVDSITFAGNGEPTLHPNFSQIMDDVVLVRDLMLPESEISILSNGSMLHRPEIFNAMLKPDHCILKLDAGSEKLFQKINQPIGNISIEKLKINFKKLRGVLTIQTLLFRGFYNGEYLDNSSPEEVELWLYHINEIQPKLVMLYSLDRPSPASELIQVPRNEIEKIAEKLNEIGIKSLIS